VTTPLELCSRCERPRPLFGTPTDTVVEVDRETTERGTVSRTLACLCPWCGWEATPKPWYWVRDTEAAERAIIESFGGDPERGPIMTDGGEDVHEGDPIPDGGVMLGTPPESSSSADSPRARYKATYRHGNGYDVVYLTDHRSLEGGRIVADDVDGNTHQWTPGADVHIVEVDR
jgi:hypothetical protein